MTDKRARDLAGSLADAMGEATAEQLAMAAGVVLAVGGVNRDTFLAFARELSADDRSELAAFAADLIDDDGELTE